MSGGEAGPAQRQALAPGLLHDLRTPLNHIIGYSELMLEEAGGEGQAAMLPYLAKVAAAGHHLLGLINDNFRSERRGAAMAEELPLLPLPPLPAAEPRDAPAADRASAAARGALLVVDDVEANRDLLVRRLTRLGYWAATAENGRQALEMMGAETFDVVLLDIMMPEMDGFEVLRRMDAGGQLRKMEVIVVSALTDTASLARCIELGASDFLRKPFDATLLRARVRASLDRKRARDREAYLMEQLRDIRQGLKELGVGPLAKPAPASPS